MRDKIRTWPFAVCLTAVLLLGLQATCLPAEKVEPPKAQVTAVLPQPVVDAMSVVLTDRENLKAAGTKIKELQAALAAAQKAEVDAKAALEQHKVALQSLWRDMFGFDVAPTPPVPPVPPTPPTPPPTPVPPPEKKAVAHYAWVIQNGGKREPWQLAVDQWATENLNSDAASQYRQDDIDSLKAGKGATPEEEQVRLTILQAVAGKTLPVVVLIGDVNGHPNQIIGVVAEPKTVADWKKLWVSKGGVL